MRRSQEIDSHPGTLSRWMVVGLSLMVVAVAGMIVARLRRPATSSIVIDRPLSPIPTVYDTLAALPVRSTPPPVVAPNLPAEKPIITLDISSQAALMRMLLLTAIIITLLLTYLFRPANMHLPVTPIVALFIAGAIVVGVTLRILPLGQPILADRLVRDASPAALTGHIRWKTLIAGLGSLLIVIEKNGQLFGFELLARIAIEVQLLLLVGGLILVTVALIGTGRFWPSRKILIAHRYELLLIAAVTALAFYVRARELNDALHIFIDEYNFSMAVLNLNDDPQISILLPINRIAAFPILFAHLQKHVIALTQRDLAGLRLLSAIIGTSTIPALYLLARQLFDRKTAFIGAALLVTLPPHVHFSRIGMNNIADPLPGTLALAFMVLALRIHRRRYFVLAGLSLGMTQYFYEVGRLFYPILMLAWVAAMLIVWRRRVQWRGLLLTISAAILTSAPMYASWLARGYSLTPRLNENSFAPITEIARDSLQAPELRGQLLAQVKSTLLHYIHLPDVAWWYGGDQPLLLWYLVPFALLGLFIVVWRWRTSGGLLLLLWLGGVAVGNSLAIDPGSTQRYVVVLPALVLIVAVGLNYALNMLWNQRRNSYVHGALIALFLIPVSFGQVDYYFNQHLPVYIDGLVTKEPGSDLFDAVQRASDLPENTVIHFSQRRELNAWFYSGVYVFLAKHDNPAYFIPTRFMTAQYIADQRDDVNQAFFIEHQDLRTREMLWQFYPSMSGPTFSSNNLPFVEQFELYYIPVGTQRVIPHSLFLIPPYNDINSDVEPY